MAQSARGAGKIETVTGRQRAAIAAYTGNGYARINEGLREGGRLAAQEHIKQLDSLFQRSSQDAPKCVFRGIGGDFALALQDMDLRPGTEIVDAGFLSASRDFDVALRYAKAQNDGMVIQINLRPEAKFYDLASYSNFPSEEEILLPRGSRMVVIGYRAQDDTLIVELVDESQ